MKGYVALIPLLLRGDESLYRWFLLTMHVNGNSQLSCTGSFGSGYSSKQGCSVASSKALAVIYYMYRYPHESLYYNYV